MSNAIIDGTNIDLSVFSYSAPKPHASGSKVVNLYNKHVKESLTIAVPLMGTWGAQESKEVIGKGADGKPITRGTGKYTMSLQFAKGQYTTPDADKFLEQMRNVENKIKTDAMVYSKEWFGKEIKSMDVMDEKFGPMLKYPKIKGTEERNFDEPPSLSLKLPCWKDVWQTSVFDEEYNPLYVKGKTDAGVTPLEFLVNPSKIPIQVVALIQCGGLWFVGNPSKISVTWNLKQVIVRKPKTSSIADDMCFLSVSPTDMAALKASPQPELEQNDNNVSALVEDSDDEEYKLPPPPPQSLGVAPVVPVAPIAPIAPIAPVAPVDEVVNATNVEEPKKKKVVSKKKIEA
jgi:hypothetical protein